jgi:hypothetical protein
MATWWQRHAPSGLVGRVVGRPQAIDSATNSTRGGGGPGGYTSTLSSLS